MPLPLPDANQLIKDVPAAVLSRLGRSERQLLASALVLLYADAQIAAIQEQRRQMERGDTQWTS